MRKPFKRKRLEESIMLFEEWKDSEDYLIQAWFFATNKKVRQWFEDKVLNGFQFDDFQWTASDTYLIYTAHLEFQEQVMEYKLDIILEFEHVKEGKVDQFEVVLSGYTIKDFVMVGQVKDTVKDSDFNATWLASLIQKFKELYPIDDKNIKLDTEVADDGGSNNEAKGGVNKKYTHFAVNKETGKIATGWETISDVESLKYYAKTDLEDMDLKPSDFKILSSKALIRSGVDPYNYENWAKSGEVN